MKGSHLNYRDSSLGNILFGGCFLEADCDFNEAVKTYVQFCEVHSSVLNITDGKNLVLSALKEDGHYLPDESSVVSPHKGKGKITELFLQDSYLSEEEINLFGMIIIIICFHLIIELKNLIVCNL